MADTDDTTTAADTATADTAAPGAGPVVYAYAQPATASGALPVPGDED